MYDIKQLFRVRLLGSNSFDYYIREDGESMIRTELV